MSKHERSGAWWRPLRLDPVPTLLASGDAALAAFTRRDLLGERTGPIRRLWELAEPQRILRKQREDGSWFFRGASREKYPEINHDLFETYKQLSRLIDMYGFTRKHPAIARAAEYVFSCQSEEGDIRGILGTQYIPYYHGVLCELLIRAGYARDPRLERGLQWILDVRQEDGAWMIPLTARKGRPESTWSAPPIGFEPHLPSSHMATGMVIRALVAHPTRRRSRAARAAGAWLKQRLFEPDDYGSRQAPEYWTKMQYPFFWTSLLTALDSLAMLGFGREDPDVRRGLGWFVENQQPDGLWRSGYEQTPPGEELRPRERENRLWVGLAACRVFKRLS